MTNRPDGRRRESRPRKDRAPEIGEQQEGEAVQLQAEGVGAETMTAEARRGGRAWPVERLGWAERQWKILILTSN